MARREFLLLATPFDPEKHLIGGYYMSEKHDGVRAFWDGGISRGLPTVEVPWAGTMHPKTGQRKTDIHPVATGLWSRYGNPIVAPDWFLNTLPACPLDGELWAGRKRFQDVLSFAKKKKPVDTEWQQLQYGVFGTPNWYVVMGDGEIRNANQATDIRWANVERYSAAHQPDGWITLTNGGGKVPFSAELANLVEWIDPNSDTVFLIPQTKLPDDHEEAFTVAFERMKQVVAEGGEGLVLKDPNMSWVPKREKTILKFKDINDSEGIVTGFTSGRETNKGSKLRGMIGAVILDYEGKRLEMSGFTNEERTFASDELRQYAWDNPDQDMPAGTQGKHFKVGDRVTFVYREHTKEGIPKEARYFRHRPVE